MLSLMHYILLLHMFKVNYKFLWYFDMMYIYCIYSVYIVYIYIQYILSIIEVFEKDYAWAFILSFDKNFIRFRFVYILVHCNTIRFILCIMYYYSVSCYNTNIF